LLRLHAERAGYRVIPVSEGPDTSLRAALHLACREQPCVILLESDLPDMLQAGELLQILKADRSTLAIPVVLLT
jgi:CheY-like chemotaxis protein